MNANNEAGAVGLEWPSQGQGVTRVPGALFFDAEIYALEQERIFRGPVWNFVALEAELPSPGDYRAVQVADSPVLVCRDRQGQLHAWLNRCSHRNARVCLDQRGNVEDFTCVYHQWRYGLDGALLSVPFERGLGGQGGMPADFDREAVRPRKLRVATHAGVIFVSFSDAAPPLLEYLGPTVSRFMARIFSRPVTVLGHQHQRMNGNWKLYAENPRDGYHASLLHLFFPTFGLFRASQQGRLHVEGGGLQTCLYTFVDQEDAAAKAQGSAEAGRTYRQDSYRLADPRLLSGRMEYEDGINLVIIDVFPVMMLQQIGNVLNIRQFEPHGPESVTVHYTFFGYADDDADLREMRLKQINLIGPAGLVSMEDGLAIEIVQQGIARDPQANAIIEMGGREANDQSTFLASEDPVRGFWNGYRRLMGW